MSGLCDVGGCGNRAIGEEVAIYVSDTGDYLEVSLCGDHPELTSLQRGDVDYVYTPPDLSFTYHDVPVIEGVATLPNGMTVKSAGHVVRVAVPNEPPPNFGQQIVVKDGLPRGLRERIDAIERGEGPNDVP